MRMCRAVCDAEAEQVLRTGKLETIPGSLEGKWLAEQSGDARKWGAWLGRASGTPHDRIIVVEVPDDVASRLFRIGRLDGIGPGRFAEISDLPVIAVVEVTT